MNLALIRRDLRAAAPLAAVVAAIPAVAKGPALGFGNLMALAFESVAAFALGVIVGVNSVAGDLESAAPFLVSGLGRSRYAAARVLATMLVAAIAASASLTALLTSQTPHAIVATAIASSLAGALVGVLAAASVGSRGEAMAVGVALWAALTILYDVALAVADLAVALTPREVLAALLANPATAVRLAGLALVDPSLLTLGPPGAEAYRVFGPYAPIAIALVAVAWIAALGLAAWASLRRVQIQ